MSKTKEVQQQMMAAMKAKDAERKAALSLLLSALKAKAKDYETRIESRILTSFKRIRKNARNGLGIVYVQRDACGGCFNKIPPQRQLDIKMHKKIIVCEYCGRILIDPELAGVKIDKPVEKKPKKRPIRKRTKDEE